MKFSAGLLVALPLVFAQDTSSVASAVSSAVESVASSVAPSGSASAPAPSGSQDFATGLVAALNARGATTLASLLTPLAGAIGPILQSGDHTVFAPSNQALAGVDTSNATALQQILTYHILPGLYPAAAITANNTIAATLLQGAPTVNLPNNAAQALTFYKDEFGTTRIQGQNASVLANATYQNVLVKLIDGVLLPPAPIPAVLSGAAESTALVQAVAAIAPDLVSALNTTAGLTVFAPTDEAVSAVASTLAGADPAVVAQVIQGHVLPQVVYSANITDGLSAPTLAGNNLSLSVNATGVFVTSNGATAQVVATDFIAANGVIHKIDAVLFNPTAPSGSASSAVASASDAASSVVASATEAVASVASSAAAARRFRRV